VLIITTMKVSTATAITIAAACASLRGAAARSIVTPLSGINLFPAANYEIDVNAAHENSIDGLGSVFGRHDLTRKYGGRAYGNALLHPPLLGQIVEEVGRDNVNAAALDAVHRQVQTLRITGTSPWHTDCEMDGPQQRKPIKNEPLQVGLFFGNTNEDAYFEIMDGKLCIPIIAETFVSFDGRSPHRTVVMSGHVDMVGPFSLSSDVLANVAYVGTADSELKHMLSRRRQLSVAENNSTIKGTLVMGDITNKEKYPFDHFLKVNGTGLPSNCTDDCAIAIGLADSRDCAEDIHDSALKVLLPKGIFYSTDEGGSTKGWHKQMFDNVESEGSPILLSEVFSMVGATAELIDSLTNSTYAPVVYLYDKEKLPVACAFLEPLTDEEKEEYDMLFNGEQQDDADISADAPAEAVMGGGNGAGSVGALPTIAVSAIMTCALLLLSW
jgi:hypothetical protein